MSDRLRTLAPWLAVAACALIASWQGCQASRWRNARSEAIERSVVWETRALNAERVNANMTDRIGELAMAVTFTQDTAKRERNRADSLARVRRRMVPVPSLPATPPTVADTLRAVEAQLENCEQEGQALRAESGSLTQAITAGEERAKLLELGRDSALAALHAGRDVVATLRDQLRKSDPPCYLLPFVRCPSRTVMFVGGVVVGVITVKYGDEIVAAAKKQLQ